MSSVEEQIESLLEKHLGNLEGLHRKARANHNIFLGAISPAIADTSGLTRSLTSKLGNSLHRIARGLATLRFGETAVPSFLGVSSGTAMNEARDDDTVISCSWDEQETRTAATRLLREAGTSRDKRIGGTRFLEAYSQEMERLRGTRSDESWSLRVDLVVLDEKVGICELESGGELDTSNVKGQPEKLILAGLAYGDSKLPLHFSLAYANNGEGQPIRGGLPKYLEYESETSGSGGLLVGRAWWERVLPRGITYEDFLGIFEDKVADLDVVPPRYRPSADL